MKKLFSRNDQHHSLVSFVNWRTDSDDISNMLVLADGYFSSGIELTQRCLNDNESKEADKLIFPIFHNVNHGIELYLKALIWKINKLLGKPNRIEGKHNIKQIYENAKEKVRLLHGVDGVKHYDEVTKELRLYIEELYEVIQEHPNQNRIDFSRYPISKGYEQHFYVRKWENIEVDLENLITILREIYEKLDDLTSYYYHEEFLPQEKNLSKTKFIRVEIGRGGKTKFKMFQLDIFKFLLQEFGYSYIIIKGKGKYLKSAPSGYKLVPFQKLKDDFTEYLRSDFNRNTLPDAISYEDFMNKYYQSNPITQPYARSFFKIEDRLNEKDFVLEDDFLVPR